MEVGRPQLCYETESSEAACFVEVGSRRVEL